jgi:hypothetical protein
LVKLIPAPLLVVFAVMLKSLKTILQSAEAPRLTVMAFPVVLKFLMTATPRPAPRMFTPAVSIEIADVIL